MLEKAYEKKGKRTKKSISGLPLNTLGWISEHKNAFNQITCTLG